MSERELGVSSSIDETRSASGWIGLNRSASKVFYAWVVVWTACIVMCAVEAGSWEAERDLGLHLESMLNYGVKYGVLSWVLGMAALFISLGSKHPIRLGTVMLLMSTVPGIMSFAIAGMEVFLGWQ